MITGFQAQMEVNDGEASASVKFSGLVTFSLPPVEASTFDATELDQQADSAADPWERELPTGLRKAGPVKAEIKFTKANYQRLMALVGVRGKTYILTSPDDLTGGSPTKLTCTFSGFVSKVDEVKWEKKNPSVIPFEVVVQSKPAYA